MHDDVPVTRFSIGAAPGRRPGLRALLMLLLGASMVCATALAGSPAKKAAGAQAKAAAPASSDYVGAEVCAACHQTEANGFANNPHTKMVLMHGDKGITCENCHGPGKAHAEAGGDKTKIFNFTTATPQQIDAKCLSCHAGTHPNFLRSPHAKAGVSCASCHSIHDSKDPQHLLKASQPTLCYQCHGDVKPSFSMPFHHRVNEGLVKCSDCHDVHGTFGNNNLRTTADQNQVCTKCHTDVRGPFVYEHAPVKAEGCTSCHSPHGSQNARLLNMPNIDVLCSQCHSPVANHTIQGMGPGSSTVTTCIDCHTMIHGSNISQAFIR